MFPPCPFIPGGIGDLIYLPHLTPYGYVNLFTVKTYLGAPHSAVSPAYALNFSNATNVITVWGPRRT